MCNQPARFDLHRPAIEVGTAEVMVFGAMFEDVIDRGEDRCGDGANGFLRPALGLEAEELSPVVAVFRALGGPGALHEHGFEPGRPLAQARGLALAGTFVVPRAQPGPGDEVAPMMSQITELILILAPASVFSIRCTCRVCSRTNCLRVRVSARSSCTSSFGTKLAWISPQANRSAIHIASFMSVLRPGTFLMCAALATIKANLSASRSLNTGIQ